MMKRQFAQSGSAIGSVQFSRSSHESVLLVSRFQTRGGVGKRLAVDQKKLPAPSFPPSFSRSTNRIRAAGAAVWMVAGKINSLDSGAFPSALDRHPTTLIAAVRWSILPLRSKLSTSSESWAVIFPPAAIRQGIAKAGMWSRKLSGALGSRSMLMGRPS